MTGRSRTRALAQTLAPGALFAAGAAVVALSARQLVRRQAIVARRAIGKPLGEDPHRADKLYRSKYGDPIHLLLLGDSIAAGLGADKPKRTLGVQLAKRLADRTDRAVRLHTAAIVGSETSMLRTQLAGLPSDYVADIAVVIVGGNDVTHRVKTSVSCNHLTDAVTALQGEGTHVVVGTCPDLSALGAVPQPLRTIIGVASRQLATAQRETAIGIGARVVSLGEVLGPFFVAKPDKMFAIDRFHPSSAGYRRTAKAILPSILAALGDDSELPFGHHAPASWQGVADRGPTVPAGTPPTLRRRQRRKVPGGQVLDAPSGKVNSSADGDSETAGLVQPQSLGNAHQGSFLMAVGGIEVAAMT